jgi:hypothetical protein
MALVPMVMKSSPAATIFILKPSLIDEASKAMPAMAHAQSDANCHYDKLSTM